MAIISRETFEKFTEEEKNDLIEYYKDGLSYPNDLKQSNDTIEFIFGKENLQPEPEPGIKTWKAVEENNLIDETLEEQLGALSYWNGKTKAICDKCAATLKIAKLIELGYGGMVSEEEWKDDTICKECVVPYDTKEGFKIITRFFHSDKNLIAFHTQQQAEEFMSYPENRKLVKQYYMI